MLSVRSPLCQHLEARTKCYAQAKPVQPERKVIRHASRAQPEAHPPLSRQAFAALTAVAVTLGSGAPSMAAAPVNQAPDAKSLPMVQEMLKRTEEKREERRVERLNDYYKRNFKDYFEFEGGSADAAKARGISTKNQEDILKWLEQNK